MEKERVTACAYAAGMLVLRTIVGSRRTRECETPCMCDRRRCVIVSIRPGIRCAFTWPLYAHWWRQERGPAGAITLWLIMTECPLH
jgi:hypothetical protein